MLDNKLLKLYEKPELYSSGSDSMWTDPYISRQLLEIHLDKGIDLASRKELSINITIDWLLSGCGDKQLQILDLGCGPGLYAERIARSGHSVCGIDFSKTSIDYAIRSAVEKGLSIEYLNADYLEVALPENSFDLVTMIYTDFGALRPAERILLLNKIRLWLKPGGIFIFDVLNSRDWKNKAAPGTWESSAGGFWAEGEFLRLSDSFIYEEPKVILYRHLILNGEGMLKTYHFWTTFFSDDDIEGLLYAAGFRTVSIDKTVLPIGDEFNGDNVTFVSAGC